MTCADARHPLDPAPGVPEESYIMLGFLPCRPPRRRRRPEACTPLLLHSREARMHPEELPCYALLWGGRSVPAKWRAVGAPASAPVGAHPAQGLWWGLASRPAARTAAFAPQSGATGQGGPSPRVGWVDLPGAYAPGGGLQGSSQKVTCTDERGPCPSVRWRQGRASKRIAAMVGHLCCGDCRSDVGGPRCAIPTPLASVPARWTPAGRCYWADVVRPCGPVRLWGGKRPALGRVEARALGRGCRPPCGPRLRLCPSELGGNAAGPSSGVGQDDPPAAMRAGVGDPRGMGRRGDLRRCARRLAQRQVASKEG